MVHRVLSVTAALALAVFSALPASAQITTGNVLGTIKDAQGGVVPGATVVLLGETKGTKSAPVVTNATGDYVTGLNYNYEVELPTIHTLIQQPAMRLDYQPASKWRLTGKYAGQMRSKELNSIGGAAAPNINTPFPASMTTSSRIRGSAPFRSPTTSR